MAISLSRNAKYICFVVVVLGCIFIWRSKQRSKLFSNPSIDHWLELSNGTYDQYAQKAYQDLEERISTDSSPRAQDLFDQARILHLYRDEGEIRNANGYAPVHLYTKALQSLPQQVGLNPNETLQMTDQAADYLMKVRQTAPHVRPSREELQLQEAIEATRIKVKEDLLQNKVTSDNKLKTTTDYLDRSKGWTTDTQNVHDSSVQKTMRNTIANLAKKNMDIVPPPGEPVPSIAVVEYMNENASKFSPETRKKAKFALDTMNRSTNIHAGLEHNEQQILDMVWRRSFAAENQHHADDIREMTVNSLADMVTDVGYDGKPQLTSVCSSGRIARAVDALTVLDQDATFGQQGPMTLNAIRNSVFDYSQEALQNHLQLAKESTDPRFQTLAQSYSDPAIEVDPQIESQFKSQVVTDVRNHLTDHYLESLSEDAQISIMDHVEAAL